MSLPWWYAYIIARARHVKAVQEACAQAQVPPPDPHEIAYWDVPAITAYIRSMEHENQSFAEEANRFYGGG